jgi:putative membrane protein
MKTSPVTAAILLSLVTGVSAQNPASAPAAENPKTAPAAELSSTDRAFITKAAEGGKAEIELGQLAQQKASTDAVKALGKRIADDHQLANRDLETIAGQKHVTLPSSLSAKHSALKSKLESASGAAFDRQYVAAMIEDHKHDIAEFEKAASDARDADVKAFASKTLPTLQEHLRQAEAAAGK